MVNVQESNKNPFEYPYDSNKMKNFKQNSERDKNVLLRLKNLFAHATIHFSSYFRDERKQTQNAVQKDRQEKTPYIRLVVCTHHQSV